MRLYKVPGLPPPVSTPDTSTFPLPSQGVGGRQRSWKPVGFSSMCSCSPSCLGLPLLALYVITPTQSHMVFTSLL